MAVDVLLSQFGMGMQEAKILQWYVAAGDAVTLGQPICEIETAKAVVEIQAPASGVLASIVVPADETAHVRELIAVIDDGAGDVASADTGAALAPVAEPPHATSIGPSKTGGLNSDIQVEPRARRRAAELGVDLAGLKGSGPGGRITTADVDQASQSTKEGL